MDNEKLLAEIARMFKERDEKTDQQIAAMDEKTDRRIAAMEEKTDRRIAAMEEKFDKHTEEVAAMFREQNKVMTEYIDEKIDESERRINLKIENDIGKRLDALSDGYTLIHEKQWALEHKVQGLEKRLEALENKGA